jgi:hypothetical protein
MPGANQLFTIASLPRNVGITRRWHGRADVPAEKDVDARHQGRKETPMDDHFLFAIFSPDETLSCDSTYNYAQWRQCEPERNLLAAVLKDALLTYRRRFSLGDARFREAERWLFSEDSDGLFAFKSVCSMLHLSADRIRKDLRAFAGAVGEAPGFAQPRRSRTVRSRARERSDLPHC